MFEFKLQLFAEEESADTDAKETRVDGTGEESKDEKPAKEPIPDELAGVSEETAREIMEQAKQEQRKDESESKVANDVQDTETKPVGDDTFDEVNQKVPYVRFKEQVDKSHEIENELKKYKEKFGDLNAPNAPAQAQPPQQTVPQQPPEPPAPQFRLSEQVMKQINALAVQNAMQMTGMTKDDYDALEYADDDDSRKQTFNFALNMARNNIMNGIQRAEQIQNENRQKFLAAHRQAVQGYNDFAQKEMASPDFEQVKNYATNEYFESLSQPDQNTVAAAYMRIERNIASPAEIALVKSFYRDAKAAYHAKNPQAAKPAVSNQKQKIKQAQSMPRADKVNGAAGGDETVSEDTLRQMLNNTPWDEIPKKYQKMLLGMG